MVGYIVEEGGERRYSETSAEGLSILLSSAPRSWSDTLIARGVLRHFHLFAGDFASPSQSIWPLLRGIILPWLIAGAPEPAQRLREIARHLAPTAAKAAATATGSRWGGGAAADLGARAVYAVFAREAAVARTAAAVAGGVAGHWRGHESALGKDIDLLRSAGPEGVRGAPLWQGPLDEWAEQDRQEAFAALERVPGANWRPVWLDWYEALLAGSPPWGLPRDIGDAILTEAVCWSDAEWARGPAHINGRILAEITARHQTRAAPAKRDFFVSYCSIDEVSAREIDDIVRSLGFTTFVQFKDMGPGTNFVREMQRGLTHSARLIALYSPDYESSAQCQAEWSVAYNADPAGVERKLVPFLLRPTALNALARQVVYRSLVGLDPSKRRGAVIDALASLSHADAPASIEQIAHVASPGFRLREGKIDVGPGLASERMLSTKELQRLPKRQRELVKTVLGGLSDNTPRLFKSCLQKYERHLRGDADDLIIGVLEDHWQCARAFLEGHDRLEFDAGLTKALENLERNHNLLVSHFPMWEQRERAISSTPVDEAAASGKALIDPTRRVAAAVEQLAASGQATEAFVAFNQDIREMAEMLAYQPPAATSGRLADVSSKQRFVLSTVGFYDRLAQQGRGGWLAHLSSPESKALEEAAATGLKEMAELVRAEG